MANEIKSMLNAIVKTRKDWVENFKEDARGDWRVDFDAVAGDAVTIPVANTVLPVISGTTTVGQTLAVTTGTWTGTPTPTYTYQWKAANVNIAGATAASLVLAAPQQGKVVTCVVTATNGSGSPKSVTTVATAAIAAA